MVMLRRVLLAVAVVPVVLSTIPTSSAFAGGSLPYRPDAWIKLCGQSTGCTINPPPHPWKGNNVYNTTGDHQTIPQKIEEGEGVRFWILLQNDGTTDDTVTVQGCPDTNQFYVNKVLMGEQKRPHWPVTDVTKAFKKGTLQFDLKAADANKAVFTLNIIERSNATVGVTKHCDVTITSAGDPSLSDTLVTTMTAT
jgi:hypothetical protein